jgi:hypothetical protein
LEKKRYKKENTKNKTIRDPILQFYKAMPVLILMCGPENWAVNRVSRRITETTSRITSAI